MTAVRSIIPCGCETWTLSVEDINSLLVFGRHILRRMYGAVQTEEEWRVKNKIELEKLMRGEDIVKYVRPQRIKWWGILKGWKKRRQWGKIMESHPIGMRSKGRPKIDGEMC